MTDTEMEHLDKEIALIEAGVAALEIEVDRAAWNSVRRSKNRIISEIRELLDLLELEIVLDE